MNPQSQPVKRYRGRSVDHCTDPLMPTRARCWDCAAKDEQIARLIDDNRRLNHNVDLLRDLINTAAQMAIEEGAPDA